VNRSPSVSKGFFHPGVLAGMHPAPSVELTGELAREMARYEAFTLAWCNRITKESQKDIGGNHNIGMVI